MTLKNNINILDIEYNAFNIDDFISSHNKLNDIQYKYKQLTERYIKEHDFENMKDNAKNVFTQRYVMKNEIGLPKESISDVYVRVAQCMSEDDQEIPNDKIIYKKMYHYLRMISSHDFLPNSPTFTGAKTDLGQLAACFVLPIEDDLGRHEDGILSTLRNAGLIQQTGGGNGFSFSRLRPKNSYVSTSGGKASGPVSFLKSYDGVFGTIAQGGTRRGANMAVMRVDHPDIEEFIKCKAIEGNISNFNISVAITDEFMKAVNDNTKFDLLDPSTNKITKRVNARDLYDTITTYAHRNGEPGILFIDTANKYNPVPHIYDLEATNPCLSGNTWVTTDRGPKQVKDLLDKKVRLVRHGEMVESNDLGFFITGEKKLFEITTKRGFKIQVTDNHLISKVKLKTRNSIYYEWTKCGDLDIGDNIQISNNIGSSWNGKGTYDEGYMIGSLIGDGTIYDVNGNDQAVISVWGNSEGNINVVNHIEEIAFNMNPGPNFKGFSYIEDREEYRLSFNDLTNLANEYGLTSDNKEIGNLIEETSSDFHIGLIKSLFDCDGSVQDRKDKGISIRLAQSNVNTLRVIQRMLSRFGIISTIYENRRKEHVKKLPSSDRNVYKEYNCKAQHELIISKMNIKVYKDVVGFSNTDKTEKLESLLSSFDRNMYRERFIDSVIDIQEMNKENVFDVQIPNYNSFDANGLHVHNCGEQWLGPYENCCLGSINLSNHFDEDKKQVNWDKLAKTSCKATNFLDDVVSKNKYVDAIPQLKINAHKTRRIGLGIMGLGDLLYKLGIGYGTMEACELLYLILKFIRYYSMITSIKLSKQYGPFKAFRHSIYDHQGENYDPNLFLPREFELSEIDQSKYGMPELFWDDLVEEIKSHGIRNCCQMTVAPTGTISTVSSLEGYGLEPVFALGYKRHFDKDGVDTILEYTSDLLLDYLRRNEYSQDDIKQIKNYINENKGTLRDCPFIEDEVKDIFRVSSDVSTIQHINMQYAAQLVIDNSISKTCNLPSNTSVQDVKDTCAVAHARELKGFTIYVEGSREKVVLETDSEFKRKQKNKTNNNNNNNEEYEEEPQISSSEQDEKKMRIKVPNMMTSISFNKMYNGIKYHGHFNVLDNDMEKPIQIFFIVGQGNSEISNLLCFLGQMCSFYLRKKDNIPTIEKMKEILLAIKEINRNTKEESIPRLLELFVTNYLKESGFYDENYKSKRKNIPSFMNSASINHRIFNQQYFAYFDYLDNLSSRVIRIKFDVGSGDNDLSLLLRLVGSICSLYLSTKDDFSELEKLKEISEAMNRINGGKFQRFKMEGIDKPFKITSIPQVLGFFVNEYLKKTFLSIPKQTYSPSSSSGEFEEIDLLHSTESDTIECSSDDDYNETSILERNKKLSTLTKVNNLRNSLNSCPNCSKFTLIYIEGCEKCISCDYTRC